MIIADPFGSWVQGAREGTQDALALRRGADESAQANYGLTEASLADPYRLQQLRNATTGSNINTDILQRAHDSGDLYNIEHAKAVMAQLQPGATLANLGVTGPLAGAIPGLFPGTTAAPTPGGPVFKTDTGNGTSVANPLTGIISPNQLHWDAYGQRFQQQQQQLEAYRQAHLQLQAELAAFRAGTHPSQINNPTTTTGNSGAFTIPSAQQPQQPQQPKQPQQPAQTDSYYQSQYGVKNNLPSSGLGGM